MRDPIDIAAYKISLAIKKANPEETKSSVEVMTYALSLLINTILTTILILYIGVVTSVFQKTLVILIVFAALRMLTGGFHFKSLTICVIVTTALIVPVPHVNYPEGWILPITLVCTAIILWKSKVKIVRRILSAGLVIAISMFADQALTLICLVYALVLIPERR
ncbi:accessory gene regulator B family protein [Paenibacillus allorhizosphaerae]|uniref:Accessory gene regulator protein B n=1 Tax=Paenibacillus allorhizosphaerae TaxID=2849866 RepID=A0ABM8VEG0_9BACL|nr:accessory gene regulator B family protein [Paenibacillus allorhizosphaerae]CAG7630861.1 Accessory gene regulator protein B [Paenibacillus allorhizosphaerae]